MPAAMADQPHGSGVERPSENGHNADDWAREEGIPQFSDPFIQKYFNGRDALVAQEDKHRSDLDFREMLSPMAQEACAIVSQIRYEELQTIWTDGLEDELAKQHGATVYPGMMFGLAKRRIESTKLWKIVQKMPKGTLLHCHLEAMVDQDWLFREVLATPGMHLSAPSHLATNEARETVMFDFHYKTVEGRAPHSIWDVEYESKSLVPLEEAVDSFPLGGREGFIAWAKSRASISTAESISHHCGATAIWTKFQNCFHIIRSVLHYEPIFRKFLNRMFQQLAADNVQWVDIRAAFMFLFYRDGTDVPLEEGEGYLETIRILGEEIEKFKATEEGKNFWGARMIWTGIRSLDDRRIVENMKHCITVKQEFPELIAGFDFVGHEDPGRSLAELTPLLFWFRKKCAEAGVDIPFFFHAGETLGSGSEADSNLFDALTLGTRRLGHAFSLYKHPLLMNMVRDRRILVECCPISNEILRLTSSMLSHPLPALLANGVPVSLSNDDPAMLGQDNAGMSHDFFQALIAIESLGLDGLGALTENSVRWAAFEDETSAEWMKGIKAGKYGDGVRAQRMKEWGSSWEKFCQWVVMEFGVDQNLDVED